jgi:PIN domain nuclease of toxin-antitoxin system
LRLLLDTHILLWSVAEPERLPLKFAKELESESNELWFSPISVWEMLLLAEKGHISVGPDRVKSVREIIRIGSRNNPHDSSKRGTHQSGSRDSKPNC